MFYDSVRIYFLFILIKLLHNQNNDCIFASVIETSIKIIFKNFKKMNNSFILNCDIKYKTAFTKKTLTTSVVNTWFSFMNETERLRLVSELAQLGYVFPSLLEEKLQLDLHRAITVEKDGEQITIWFTGNEISINNCRFLCDGRARKAKIKLDGQSAKKIELFLATVKNDPEPSDKYCESKIVEL